MAETAMRRSPIAGLRADMAAASIAGVVTLRELPVAEQVGLRGEVADERFAAAVRSAVGIGLPAEPNRFTAADGVGALWLGPDEWLLVREDFAGPALAPRLSAALEGLHAAVTDLSAARLVLELAGPQARAVLAKGCALDLHPRAFAPGRCAQSLLAKAQVILQQTDDAPTYRLYVRPSFAHYLVAWLADAMREYRR